MIPITMSYERIYVTKRNLQSTIIGLICHYEGQQLQNVQTKKSLREAGLTFGKVFEFTTWCAR